MGWRYPTGGGSGDVVGPASSAANEVVLYDGATGKLIKRPGTSHGLISSGTTAQRPGTPAAAMLRYNVNDHALEYYDVANARWAQPNLKGVSGAITGRVFVASDTSGFNANAADTTSVFLAQGTTAQRPGTPSAGMTRYNTTDNLLEFYDGSSWVQVGAGGGGADTLYLWAALPGNASSTIGQLQMFGINSSNPAGVLPQTLSGSPGIDNAGNSPFELPASGTLTAAYLHVAHAAVSQATAGGAMTARINLYSAQYSGRTLITSLDFPITSAGVFNNLGGNNYQASSLTGLSVALSQAPHGLEFANRSANNNEINGLGGIYVVLRIEF